MTSPKKSSFEEALKEKETSLEYNLERLSMNEESIKKNDEKLAEYESAISEIRCRIDGKLKF